MKKINLLAVATSLLFIASGCNEEKKAGSAHIHGPNCNHTKPMPTKHVHGPNCNHTKPMPTKHVHGPNCSHSRDANVAAAPRRQRKSSFYDRTEEQMETLVRAAEGGNVRSALMLSRYYTHHQNEEKAVHWIAETRRLAQAATGDPVNEKILSMLNRMEKTEPARK